MKKKLLKNTNEVREGLIEYKWENYLKEKERLWRVRENILGPFEYRPKIY